MPKKVTIYHKETGAAELYSIDARPALANHPDEWRDRPWPSDEGKGDTKKPAPSDEGKGKH